MNEELKEKAELLISIINDNFDSNLLEMDRKLNNVLARKVFYILGKRHIHNVLTLSKYLGQNHASALHAIKSVNDLMSVYPEVKQKIEYVESIFIVRSKPKTTLELLVVATENKEYWESKIKNLKKILKLENSIEY